MNAVGTQYPQVSHPQIQPTADRLLWVEARDGKPQIQRANCTYYFLFLET